MQQRFLCRFRRSTNLTPLKIQINMPFKRIEISTPLTCIFFLSNNLLTYRHHLIIKKLIVYNKMNKALNLDTDCVHRKIKGVIYMIRLYYIILIYT